MMKFVVSAVFGLVFTLSTLSGAGAASSPGWQRYLAARTTFEQMIADARSKVEMPRLSDPTAAGLLAVLSDARGTLGSRTYDKNDLAGLAEVCSANSPMTAYMMFGVSNQVEPNTEAEDVAKKIAETTEKNMHTFQDELFPLLAFNIHCVARTIPAMTDFVLSQSGEAMPPARQNALARFRLSALSVYMGAMLIFKDENISLRNRTVILDALADTANIYAGMLQPEQRQPLVILSEGLRPKVNPSLQEWLDRIHAAMSRSDCVGLCQF